MKKIIYISTLLMLFSCVKSPFGSENTSKVNFTANANAELNIVTKTSAIYDIPLEVEDYNVNIINKNDNYVVYKDLSFNENPQIQLPKGSYTAQFVSLPLAEATFDKPMYAGSADFNVATGQTTNVSVTTSLACVVTDVMFSEKITENFVKYQVELGVNGGKTLIFDESTVGRLGYFATPITELVYTITVINQQGFQYSSTGKVSDLNNGDLLKLSLDIKDPLPDNTEPFVLDLLLHKQLNEIESVVELGAEIKNTGVPTITGRLIDLSKPIGVQYKSNTEVNIDLGTKGELNKLLFIFPSNQEPILGFEGLSVVDVLSEDNADKMGVSMSAQDGGASWLLNITNMTAKLPGTTTSAKDFFMTIGLLDKNGQYTARQVTFNVYGVKVTTTDYTYDTKQPIRWLAEGGGLTTATLKGRYNINEIPDGMTFRYRDLGETDWSNVEPEFNPVTREVWANVDVAPNGQVCEYELYIPGTSNDGGIKTFTAMKGPQLDNMSLDSWSGSGNTAGPTGPWGTPNNSLGANTYKDTGWDGKNFCARLESKTISNNFASGGLFNGSMSVNMTDTYKSSKVGVAFTGRPKKLRFYYKYISAPINKTDKIGLPGNGAVVGAADMCEVAVKFERWGSYDYAIRWRDGFYGEPDASTYFEGRTAKVKNYDGNSAGTFDADIRSKLSVGYGQMTSRGQTGWTMHEIDIKYSQSVSADHIIITAVSSAWGGYMSGGVGSMLYIDNFELIY